MFMASWPRFSPRSRLAGRSSPPRFNALGFLASGPGPRRDPVLGGADDAQLLIARLKGGERPGTGRLRFIRSCSAALLPDTMATMEQAFGVPVLEAYGMTEASHQMALEPAPPATAKPGQWDPALAFASASWMRMGGRCRRASTARS